MQVFSMHLKLQSWLSIEKRIKLLSFEPCFLAQSNWCLPRCSTAHFNCLTHWILPSTSSHRYTPFFDLRTWMDMNVLLLCERYLLLATRMNPHTKYLGAAASMVCWEWPVEKALSRGWMGRQALEICPLVFAGNDTRIREKGMKILCSPRTNLFKLKVQQVHKLVILLPLYSSFGHHITQ